MTLQLDESRPYAVNNTDLSRMAFVLNAAARFDELLRDNGRYRIEQAETT